MSTRTDYQKATLSYIHTKPDEKDLETAFATIVKDIGELYDKPSTRQQIFLRFRKAIAEVYGEDSDIYRSAKNGGLSITRDENSAIQMGIHKRRDARNDDRIEVSRDHILKLIEYLKSHATTHHHFDERMILIALATGSRFIEVLRKSEYLPVEGHPELVKVRGVAKSGNQHVVREITKPLIGITYPELEKYVDSVRRVATANGRGALDSISLTQHLNPRVNQWLHKSPIIHSLLPKMNLEKLTYHTLRKLYGNLSYELFSDGKMSLNNWLMRVLGHEGPETSLYYTNVNLD